MQLSLPSPHYFPHKSPLLECAVLLMIQKLLRLLLRGRNVLLPNCCSKAANLLFCWCQKKWGMLAFFFCLFTWITRAGQSEGDGHGRYERRDPQTFLSWRLLPWHLHTITGGDLGVSSRDRKAGDVSALAVCKNTQSAAWVWARRHIQLRLHPPWAQEGPILELFEFILVILLSQGFWLPTHSGRLFQPPSTLGDVGWDLFLALKRNLFPLCYLFDQALRKPCFMTAAIHLRISPLLIKHGRSGEGSAHSHHVTRRHFLPVCYKAAYSPVWWR